MAKKEPNASLYTSTKIGKYEIKPWTLAKLELLLPVIQKVMSELKSKNITLEDAEKNIHEIIFTVLPEVKRILSITVNANEKEIASLDIGIIISMVLTIMQQNVEVLKNSLAPIKMIVNQITVGA